MSFGDRWISRSLVRRSSTGYVFPYRFTVSCEAACCARTQSAKATNKNTRAVVSPQHGFPCFVSTASANIFTHPCTDVHGRTLYYIGQKSRPPNFSDHVEVRAGETLFWEKERFPHTPFVENRYGFLNNREEGFPRVALYRARGRVPLRPSSESRRQSSTALLWNQGVVRDRADAIRESTCEIVLNRG